MTKHGSSLAAAAASSAKRTKLSSCFAFTMRFNIFVSFHISPKTAAALANVTDQRVELWFYQLNFDYDISIRSTCSYDSLMRRLRNEVLIAVKSTCGLDEADVTKISTCANWKLWEQITGLCEENEAANSAVAKDGKFYF